jgi:hypothetical protein
VGNVALATLGAGDQSGEEFKGTTMILERLAKASA